MLDCFGESIGKRNCGITGFAGESQIEAAAYFLCNLVYTKKSILACRLFLPRDIDKLVLIELRQHCDTIQVGMVDEAEFSRVGGLIIL